MKKKNFLSGIGAKLALLTLAISGALMTGCYKDDGLDVTTPGGGGSQVLEDAVYTITGTVTDAETGENINGNVTYTDGTSKSVAFDGTYTIKIAKFIEDTKTITLSFKANNESYNGNKAIERTVVLNRAEDGNAVVYPVNVVMKKSAAEMKARPYNLSFIYKNAVTGEQITESIAMTVKLNNVTEVTSFTELAAGDYTIVTQAVGQYKSSVTLLSLPYLESEKGEVINKTVEILINPVDPEKEDTYTTLAGVIVDKNGNALLAEKIELFKDNVLASGVNPISNSANFVFTINDKEAGNYTIKATIEGIVYENGVYNIPACGNQNITIVAERPVVPTYVRPYKISYVYQNALTGEAITEALTSTPAASEITKAGEYAITTTGSQNFNSNVTHLSLEEVMSTKENDVIEKTVIISLTPVDSKETFTTLSVAVMNDKGLSVMADKIELKKDDNTVVKAIKNSASATFTINDKEEGIYKIVTTKESVVVESTGYNVPECGNQVITVVFDTNKPDLQDAKYNLTFKAIDINSNTEISGAVFTFNGIAGATASSIAAGTYTLTAEKDGYYTGKVTVVLESIKNESGVINQTITVYLRKEPTTDEPTKVIFMGEIVDDLANMINAQSITLEGSNLAVYNTNHFLFEVEVPANVDKKAWTVTAKVSAIDKDGKLLEAIKRSSIFVYEKSKGTTVINKNISYAPFAANKDGIIQIINTIPGEGEQGEIIPDVNPETGAVTEEIKTVMNGNGTVEDKTTIIIEKDTRIETAEGTPLIAPIILTRDVKEEMDPTPNTDAEYVQPAVLRSFYGNPDGAQFVGNPLKVKFADSYGGELGALQLEYKNAGVWGSDPKDALVEIEGGEYTMLVSHFSQFRAAIKGTLDKGTEGENKYGDPYTTEVNKMNNSDKDLNVTVKFKNAPTGAIYESSLEAAIAEQFKNENAQKIVKSTIENLFTTRSIAIGKDFESKDQELTFNVKPYTLVKSIHVKTVYAITTYEFILNGKTVKIVVKSVLRHDVSADTVEIGHGHSHGHGGDLNAGGGIIEVE